MLIQLVYMSAATRPFSDEELALLLIKSRHNNESLNISGMLVYHEGSFLQVLEGEEHAVEALYGRIAEDPRHQNCVMLLKVCIIRRSFGDWSMGFANSKDLLLSELPGYQDLFGKRFSVQKFASDPSTPQKLLLAFRAGEWRQNVETGEQLV